MNKSFINEDVDFIITTLNDKGYEAFIVGGCVRDMIINRKSNDIDITTSATPIEIKNVFEKTIDTGIEHGTVTVVLNKKNYEVTTYRIDGEYKDNRRPEEVTFTKNLKEDLLRRDFTMNAIAYHKDLGFTDPFGGQKDIQNKIIRGVGDADKRFKEDALRVIRGIRFSAQLNFTIEDKTYDAILNNSHLLKNISIERIRDEFIKILTANNYDKIKLLSKTNIFKDIDLDLYNYLLQNENNIIDSMDNTEPSIITRLSLFFHKYKLDELENQLRFLRLDNKTIEIVVTVVSNLHVKLSDDKYGIRKIVNNIGHEAFSYLIIVIKAITKKSLSSVQNIYNEISIDPLFIKDLSINGNDLLDIGIKDGVCIGKTLSYLMDIVLKNPSMNKKDTLLNLVKDSL